MKLIRNVALPKVETIASRLADESRWTWDVTGANYEVGEYLSGVPECWQSPRTITQKPVINLTVNMCVSGGVDASAIRARGGAVVALTLALEAAGYLVDTAIIAPMRGKEQDVWVRVHLTDQNGGPMDVDRMLYAMSHESVLRHHMFSIVHGLTGTDYVKWGVNDAPEAWQDDSPGLYIGHAFLTDAKWDDPRAVSKWVDDQFDALTSTT
jgi:hypothetical protein